MTPLGTYGEGAVRVLRRLRTAEADVSGHDLGKVGGGLASGFHGAGPSHKNRRLRKFAAALPLYRPQM